MQSLYNIIHNLAEIALSRCANAIIAKPHHAFSDLACISLGWNGVWYEYDCSRYDVLFLGA